MYILGIETSCDETSAAVVRDGKKIISCVVGSSLKFHKKYGGVIPEIASRAQLETITEITDCALEKAKIKLTAIDLLSVTSGPGLVGSLLVGISFAKALSLGLNKPLLGINHVCSHFYANFLTGEKIKLPFIALVVSGGHTSLFYIRDFDQVEVLGQTQDDACGEAFDKVAKILNLGYPGGPAIEKIALRGNPRKIKFNCSGTKNELDFSFSGIKTAVLYYTERHLGRPTSVIARRLPKAADEAIPKRLLRSPMGNKGSLAMTKERSFGTRNDKEQLINDICASFQETVIDTLIKKSLLACKLKKVNRLVIGGGVAANNRLRDRFCQAAREFGISCYFPPSSLCMDNAAMVAGLGYELYKRGHRSGLNLSVELN